MTIQWDMKHKTDNNHFDHQCHFVHFLWASNRGQQIYDMRIVQDNQKLGFQKKSLTWKKNLTLKKNPEFWKKSEFKKQAEFWKHLSFF